MSIDIIKQQTKDLIDRLKSTTNNIGLGNSGNEYTVIVETFLDKFIYEAKRTLPELADAEDVYEALERLPDEEYEEMCDMMLDTIVLKKEHLIPYLAKRQNEDNFATLFDATLEAIADTNEEIFYILNFHYETSLGGSNRRVCQEKRLLQVVNRRCGKFFF